MITIDSIIRGPFSEPYKETVKITYSTLSNEPIFVEIQGPDGNWYDGKIIAKGVDYIEAREIPYVLGATKYRLKQGVDASVEYTYTPDQVDNDGIPLPFTVQISHTKNKNPIAKASQIKGGHHVFDSVYDFLWFPKELMEPTMSAAVQGNDDVTRIYTLNWTNIADIPWPLIDDDAGVSGSFRNYWHLQSESSPELGANKQVQYAPDYQNGVPPYYENPDLTNEEGDPDRYIFPSDIEWDDERAFTANEWVNEQSPEHKWKRIRESQASPGADPRWSRPIPINSNQEEWVQENRFMRFSIKPNHDSADSISIHSYFKGEQNKFAYFENNGRVYNFYDRQPATRVWDDLTQEEKDTYALEYGGSPADPTDPLVVKRINQLWMVLATKDIHGNLKSGWSEPLLIPTGDDNLVRYSVDGGGDINAVHDKINNEGITDDTEIDSLYNAAGWVVDYTDKVHNYMAYRSATTDPWIVRKVNAETGQFTKDVYKPYPINYYDRIFNVRTKGNFVPQGTNAANNPEDDITAHNWTDAPPESIPEGYELYRATCVLSVDESKQLGQWTLALVSGRSPVLDWISSDHNAFYKKIDDTATSDEGVESMEFTTIKLQAHALQGDKDLFTLTNEDIKIVWKRVYNAGLDEDLTIFNDFGYRYNSITGEYDAYPGDIILGSNMPAGFSTSDNGKSIVVDYSQVESNAIFELTLYRNVDAKSEFNGTGLSWIPYKSEKIISDYTDRVVRSVVVSAEAFNFILKGNADTTALQKTDFTGPTTINLKAFASNVDYTNGKWYKWNLTHDFETLKETSTAAAWKDIEKDVGTYWIDLLDSDMNHQVLWNSDGFDSADTGFNVYKFQVTTTTGVVIYDYVTINRISEGAAALDIKLSPEQFVIPLTTDGLAFDGKTEKIFKVGAQNIPTPAFTWSLKDKAGNEVASKVGASQFIFNADSTALGADYTPIDLNDLKAKTPYTISVEETTFSTDNLKEEGIITTVLGGDLALKGETGEDGISLLYDQNDIVPSENDGTVLGTVSESTDIGIYRGGVAQAGGINANQYEIVLVSVPTGVTATVENYLTIRVTGITLDVPDKSTIQFKVRENGANYIVDANNNEVVFPYSLIKSKAGKHAYTVQLTNEAQVVNVDHTGIRTVELDGLTNVVAKTRLQLFQGTTELDVTAGHMSFYYNGVLMTKLVENNKTVWGQSGTTTSDYSSRNYLVHDQTTNEVYLIIGQNDTLDNIVDITLREGDTGLDMERSLTLSKVEAPDTVKQIQIIPRTGYTFTTNQKSTDKLFFDFKFRDNGQIVEPWGTVQVSLDGTPMSSFNNSVSIAKSQVKNQSLLNVQCGNIVTSLDIVNLEAAEGLVVLYCTSEVLNTGAVTTDNPYGPAGAPGGTDITYAEAKNGASDFAKSSLNNVWQKDSTEAIWRTERKTHDNYWSYPSRVVGERGEKGKNLVQVKVYTTALNPATPSGLSLPPTSWSLTIPTSGIIYMSERTYEFVGDGNGQYGKNNEYVEFEGSSWSTPVRLTGQGGTRQQAAYRKYSNNLMPSSAYPSNTMQTLTDLINDTDWQATVAETNASDSHYIFLAHREINEFDEFVGDWSEPVVFITPKASDGASGGLFAWKGLVGIPTSTTIDGALEFNIGKIQTDGLMGLHVQVKHRDLETRCNIALNGTPFSTFNGNDATTQWRTFFMDVTNTTIHETLDNILQFYSTTVDAGTIYEIIVHAIHDLQKGDTGSRGYRGYRGYTGDPGPRGYRGYKGDPGTDGQDGAQGSRGYRGYRGYKGDKGDPGEKWVTTTQIISGWDSTAKEAYRYVFRKTSAGIVYYAGYHARYKSNATARKEYIGSALNSEFAPLSSGATYAKAALNGVLYDLNGAGVDDNTYDDDKGSMASIVKSSTGYHYLHMRYIGNKEFVANGSYIAADAAGFTNVN